MRRAATAGAPPAGFTLVEVLVALLVMAVMAGMAGQGVDGIVRSRDASQVQLERTLRLNTVIAQWDQDLAAIQDSAVVPKARSRLRRPMSLRKARSRTIKRPPKVSKTIALTFPT